MLVLVTADKARRLSLVRALLEHGIFTYVVSPDTALTVCEQKDTGGVILDCVGALSIGEALCRRLRNDYPPLPIAAIVANRACPDMPVNSLFRAGWTEEELTACVLDFCHRVCGWQQEPLSTFSLTLGNAPEETVYMGYRMPLSPREHEILRCLLYRSPEYTAADDLLTLCYPEGDQAQSNLTVQIRNINRRAQSIDPRRLIVNRRGLGYRLRHGIVD